jgi:hypothetical protein
MRHGAAVFILVSIGSASLRSTLIAEDMAVYTEYLPGDATELRKASVKCVGIGSTLEGCEFMYKKNDYVEWKCESEALFKQQTAPHLLQEHDMKWLTNIVNRKGACLDLLAEKGNLGCGMAFPDGGSES